jgi:hypothetical protein
MRLIITPTRTFFVFGKQLKQLLFEVIQELVYVQFTKIWR